MISYLEINNDANVFVVGDIHGCYSLLMSKLEEVGFNKNTDMLIAVGDLVDRGKENEKCIGLLNEKWFTSVKGNHEDFCYKGMMDDSVRFYHRMKNNGGDWFYSLPDDLMTEIGKKLNDLPVLLELKYKGKKYGFVHADVPVEDWELLKEMVMNNDDQIGMERSIVDACLWSRRIVEMEYVNIAQVDRVFLGHTVIDDVKHVGNCTFLDTGGVFNEYDEKYKLSIIKL